MARAPYDFIFNAPMYILSNLPLTERHGVLAAIASRTGPIHWQLTRQELAARMKKIALDENVDGLTLAERWEVATYCIELLNMGGRIDLRTCCDVGLPARRLHKCGRLSIDWRDYIDSFVKGTVETNDERRTRLIEREHHIMREADHDEQDRLPRPAFSSAPRGNVEVDLGGVILDADGATAEYDDAPKSSPWEVI